MKRSNSESLFLKTKTYFPGGVNSPVRAFRSVGGTPLFIKKGKGAHIWDADENEFIDLFDYQKKCKYINTFCNTNPKNTKNGNVRLKRLICTRHSTF